MQSSPVLALGTPTRGQEGASTREADPGEWVCNPQFRGSLCKHFLFMASVPGFLLMAELGS